MNKFLLVILMMMSSFAWSHSIIGKWQTIDDKTKKPKAVVNIEEKNGEFFGTIESLSKNVENKCKGCKGELKDSPIIGITILKNLKQDGDYSYSGGSIFDPASGKTYKSNVHLSEDGQELKARGYIGISLIGRTQIWKRLK